MKDLKNAKKIYDHIVVPEELDARLRDTLNTMPQPEKKPKMWYISAAGQLLLLPLCSYALPSA